MSPTTANGLLIAIGAGQIALLLRALALLARLDERSRDHARRITLLEQRIS